MVNWIANHEAKCRNIREDRSQAKASPFIKLLDLLGVEQHVY